MSTSPNPERRSDGSSRTSSSPVTRHLYALGSKLNLVSSKENDSASLASTLVEGVGNDPTRQQVQSSGRGGLGNIRSIPPPSAGAPLQTTPRDHSRGRDTAPKKISTGRGGAGNFLKPSSSPPEPSHSADSGRDTSSSSGRGGLGNIRSKSENTSTSR